MTYDPNFDFSSNPDITVPCAYANDEITGIFMGRPAGEPADGNFHVTIFVQEHPSGPATDKIVTCPLFTDEEAGAGITVHVYVTKQGGGNTHKKKTGSVPTGYIGGSIAQ